MAVTKHVQILKYQHVLNDSLARGYPQEEEDLVFAWRVALQRGGDGSFPLFCTEAGSIAGKWTSSVAACSPQNLTCPPGFNCCNDGCTSPGR